MNRNYLIDLQREIHLAAISSTTVFAEELKSLMAVGMKTLFYLSIMHFGAPRCKALGHILHINSYDVLLRSKNLLCS